MFQMPSCLSNLPVSSIREHWSKCSSRKLTSCVIYSSRFDKVPSSLDSRVPVFDSEHKKRVEEGQQQFGPQASPGGGRGSSPQSRDSPSYSKDQKGRESQRESEPPLGSYRLRLTQREEIRGFF